MRKSGSCQEQGEKTVILIPSDARYLLLVNIGQLCDHVHHWPMSLMSSPHFRSITIPVCDESLYVYSIQGYKQRIEKKEEVLSSDRREG